MKVGRSPKTDPQRARVYAAEHTFGRLKRFDVGMTLKQARELAGKVCRQFNVPEVRIFYENNPNEHHGAVMEWEGKLRNPRIVVNSAHNKLDMLILLHELAHWIDALYFNTSESHGPTFVGISGWLYNHYKVIPSVGYRAILKAYGVRFRKFGLCSPDKLQTRSRKARINPT